MSELTDEQREALDVARELVSAGVPVFRATPRVWVPGQKMGFELPGGWQHAQLDDSIKEIEAWQPGDALCALMGHTLDLLDFDPRNGGNQAMNVVTEAGILPTAYAIAATPGGGVHHFVRGLRVGSRDDVRPGLDVKGGREDGSGRGFAFIAPTVRLSPEDGAPLPPYRWHRAPDAEHIAAECDVSDDTGAAMAQIVRDALSPHGRGNVAASAADDPFSLPTRVLTRDEAKGVYLPHFEAFQAMRTPEDRGFNAKLNEVAMIIGHFVPAFMTYEQAEAALYRAAEFNRSVEYQTSRGVLATIHSGLGAGMREPYTLRERSSEHGAGDGADESATPSLDPVDALMGELLTATTIRELPSPVALIGGVLNVDTTSWMIGRSGSYKTFVALDMAACVARGIAWQGHMVPHAGPVVYIVAEGARGMKLRVAAWERRYGRLDNIWFLPRPVQAKDANAWAVLVEVCRRLGALFVIIDTQARSTVGLDENDNSEMGVFVERLDQIRRATGACVLAVHHIGRHGQDARGASAIDGAQDAELRIERTADRRVTVHMDKQKDQDDSEKIMLELAVIEDIVNEEPEVASLVVVPAGTLPAVKPPQDWIDNLRGNQGEVAMIIRDHFPTGGTESNIERVLNERRAAASRARMAHGSFTSAIGGLAKKETILKIQGTQKYTLASMDDAPDLP